MHSVVLLNAALHHVERISLEYIEQSQGNYQYYGCFKDEFEEN